MSLTNTFAWIVGLAGAVAAVGYLSRATFRGLRSFWRWSKKIGKGLDASVDIVQAQLTTNGGGSLLDKVNTTHTAITTLTKQITDLSSQVQAVVAIAQQNAESQERVEGQVAAINTRLDAGEKRFRKLDRVTAALEDVARNNHPEDYPAGPDIED